MGKDLTINKVSNKSGWNQHNSIVWSVLAVACAVMFALLISRGHPVKIPESLEEYRVAEAAQEFLERSYSGNLTGLWDQCDFWVKEEFGNVKGMREKLGEIADFTGDIREIKKTSVIGAQGSEAGITYAAAIIQMECEKGSFSYLLYYDNDMKVAGIGIR